MTEKRKRFTIGLLVSGITEHYVISACQGVMHAAQEADVNLVVLPGKYIDRDFSENKDIQYEYQYNTLFRLAGPKTLDAVIVAADVIGCFTSKERIKQMLETYRGIPCVLLSSKFPGYVSVNSDNEQGIREAMEYLIQHTKCRKFGMIGGPSDNTDAMERKEAFFNILDQYRIPYTENNFVTSDLSKADKKAAAEFLNKNPDVEAVFCVNDDVAITFYEEMRKRKLVPGKDILVFGYDNSTLASKVNPALSSIWTDTNEQGEQAVHTLLKMLRGEEGESTRLPSRFVLRESVGGKRVHMDISSSEYMELIDSYVDSIFYNYHYEESQKVGNSREQFKALLQKLFKLMDMGGDWDKIFCRILEDVEKIHFEYADIDNLLTVLVEICNFVCYHYETVDDKYKVRQSFEILYQKLVHVMNHQLDRIQEKEERDNFLLKLFVNNTMQFEKGNDQSYMSLISNIGFLGIRNAEVFIFDEPITNLEKDCFQCPQTLNLKAVLKRGIVKTVPRARQKVKFAELFHFDNVSRERFSAVCLPLFCNEILYGFLICNLSTPLFDNGEFLVNQLGSAVKMIDLLRTNEAIQQKLEDSLVALRENNIQLDNLSKSDALTGIMNRRGFFADAEKRLSELRNSGKKILFSYIDMNNLKIINDRYGHDEGDFSLRLIANILTDTIGDKGIIGRIGGDEYACMLECGENEDENSFTGKIKDAFDTFNLNSEKEYNVTVSVGTYVAQCREDISLQDALSHADESLYVAKTYRVKSVAKKM